MSSSGLPTSRQSRGALWGSALLVAAVSAFALGRGGRSALADVELRRPFAVDTRSRLPERESVELLLVYVGSPACAFSRSPTVPALFDSAQRSLASIARVRSYSFSTLGLSPSGSVQSGLAHLESVASFDEVVAGRQWYNLGSLRYVYDGLTGSAATPQLLLVQRTWGGSSTPMLLAETVLFRAIGLAGIEHWARRGYAAPQDSQSLPHIK